MTKYLLYNSRLVRPEMEKPKRNSWRTDRDDRHRFASYVLRYNAHLSTLPGIKCSDKLLAKWKDGDWLEYGKDFVNRLKITIENGTDRGAIIAVPVQSDEEDVEGTWKNVMRIFREAHSESEAIKHLQSQYKLTKR